MRARLRTAPRTEWAALAASAAILAVTVALPDLVPAVLTGVLTPGGLL